MKNPSTVGGSVDPSKGMNSTSTEPATHQAYKLGEGKIYYHWHHKQPHSLGRWT